MGYIKGAGVGCVYVHMPRKLHFDVYIIYSHREIYIHVSVFKKFEIFIDCVYKAI